MSLTKIVSDVAAEAAFQRGEVEILDKVFGDEIPRSDSTMAGSLKKAL